MNLEGEQMESGSKERMMVVVGEVILKGDEMILHASEVACTVC
jgi:lipopolysaccharide export system protein LptA